MRSGAVHDEPISRPRPGAPGIFARRGMLLVVVLVIITVLALLGASFSFRMNADLASVNAMNDLQQARWAAQSGVARAIHLLRDERTDTDAWYGNHEVFRRILVWAPGEEGGSESLADQEKVEGRPAWRFSVVSYQIDGDEAQVRYGLTDEASKINLNTASRAQLLALFDQIELEDVSPEQLADVLIDWRDQDDVPMSINGAESRYYITLEPAYRAKNRPLQTVEELLMIKGFNGRILYGEDYNRNGYLDENEDDGEEGAFPPDDGDGILDRGVLPLVTVYSWDWNFANDNKRRLPLGAIRSAELLERPEFDYLAEEVSTEVIEFIVEANKRGYPFRSVGELFELEVYENGVSNYTEAWQEYDRLVADLEEDRLEREEAEEGEEELDEEPGLESDEEPELEPDEEGEEHERDSGLDRVDSEEEEDEDYKPQRRRQQSLRDRRENRADRPPSDRSGRGEGRGSRRRPEGGGRRDGADTAVPRSPEDAGGEGRDRPRGTPIVSPVMAQDMDVIMDRFTTVNSLAVPGLINVNTASPSVLSTIPGLTEEDVASIIATRRQIGGEEKMSLGWLVGHGVLDAQTFALVSDKLTTRSIQFTADVIGFADHVGAFKRIQAVIEMRGHLAQIRYYRDITSLGIGYPVWDDERSEGFAFTDQ